MTGRFITFEGGEGSGKSTQLQLLCKALDASGIDHVATREPGGSPGAERIRELLVNGDKNAWDPAAETLLFYAARLDHMHKVIKPAMDKGRLVVCDRFADSTRVYQGIGKDLSEEYIQNLHHLTLGNFAPDLTFMFDIDPAVGLKRAADRRGTENRFESMDVDFHHRVRAGFLSIAGREPQRCVIVDAAQEKIALHEQLLKIIEQRLGIQTRG